MVTSSNMLPDAPEDCFRYACERFNNHLYDELTEAGFRRALAGNPDWPEALNYLGYVLRKQGRNNEALTSFNDAISLQPEYVEARANRALVLLHLGEYRAGWREYELRLQHQPDLLPALPLLYWRGESLAGKRILLIGEQGLGDQLQFMRFAPMLTKEGGKVELLVSTQLEKIAQSLPTIENVHSSINAEPGYYDYQCSLMSLPAILGTSLETIPAKVPYLKAEVEACRHAEHSLAKLAGYKLRVGLVWAGGKHKADDAKARAFDDKRSLDFESLAPLGDLPGISFFSLQLGQEAGKLGIYKEAGWNTPLHDLSAEINDYADTAAWVSRLNLLIGCDTSIVHLAGAMGRPVWVLNRYDNCWRWLKGRGGTPWYPTMYLFRQPQPGDWQSVVNDVVAKLSALLK